MMMRLEMLRISIKLYFFPPKPKTIITCYDTFERIQKLSEIQKLYNEELKK